MWTAVTAIDETALFRPLANYRNKAQIVTQPLEIGIVVGPAGVESMAKHIQAQFQSGYNFALICRSVFGLAGFGSGPAQV